LGPRRLFAALAMLALAVITVTAGAAVANDFGDRGGNRDEHAELHGRGEATGPQDAHDAQDAQDAQAAQDAQDAQDVQGDQGGKGQGAGGQAVDPVVDPQGVNSSGGQSSGAQYPGAPYPGWGSDPNTAKNNEVDGASAGSSSGSGPSASGGAVKGTGTDTPSAPAEVPAAAASGPAPDAAAAAPDPAPVTGPAANPVGDAFVAAGDATEAAGVAAPVPDTGAVAAPAPPSGPEGLGDLPLLGSLGSITDHVTDGPSAARALLSTGAGQSLAVIGALLGAIVLFLMVHRRSDRSDRKLAAARSGPEVARFR
jgi:hypothetical protein